MLAGHNLRYGALALRMARTRTLRRPGPDLGRGGSDVPAIEVVCWAPAKASHAMASASATSRPPAAIATVTRT